ncbi:unnamed protein product [Auanema sp. JU1783]|nr:unnamed protein product [Auanema sp. JU1783]
MKIYRLFHSSILLFIILLTTLVESDPCPNQYSFNEEFQKCYKLLSIPQAYQKADSMCRSYGGFLASIHSTAENEYVNKWLQNQGGHNEFWIGLNSFGGFWNWDDNSQVNFTAWGAGQPTQSMDSCVESSKNKWLSVNCFKTLPCVCSTNMIPTTVAPTSTPKPLCPHPYTHFDPSTSYCYYVGTSTSFWSAENFCTAIGGHLASIEDGFENMFIVSIATTGAQNATEYDMTWIGAHYSEDRWFWTDGSEFKYTNWMISRPIRSAKLSCATLIQDKYAASSFYIGLWDNLKCDDVISKFVCKKKLQ